MKNRTPTQISFPRGWLDILKWAVWCTALAGAAYAYGQKPDAHKVEESLKRVQQWQLHKGDLEEQIYDVGLLARTGATPAMPALKEEFAATKETSLKVAIASALVTLGEKDAIYWDFLADEARRAVENDAPSFAIFDSEGRVTRSQGQLPPEFIAWAKDHNLDPSAAAQAQVYEIPANLSYLARTGDPRGRELLRRGLKSRNFLIQSNAARGLAKLQDKESIPLIIEACRRAPAEAASIIAVYALPFFDDPRAQSAAEMFVDKQMLEEFRRLIREHGADPFRLY